MIARRKVAFLRLCAILRSIEADLDNFDAVRALNLGVLKEILNDERHIRRLRGLVKDLNRRLKTERPSKAEAQGLRKETKRHESAIKRYEGQLFIWRCIADGLVYAYISTFNAKHAYFESDTFGVKPSAGFIGGKDGLRYELGMLLSAIEHKVPAVLSDITNIIRYGDVCLLGGPDPVPMEVKSRAKLNQRGKRQSAKLNLLETFLKEDVATGFRGLPEMRRVAYGIPHRDCLDDLNACIQNARRDGWNAVCPEKGLAYMATFTGKLPEGFFESLNMTWPIVFTPNGDKIDHALGPLSAIHQQHPRPAGPLRFRGREPLPRRGRRCGGGLRPAERSRLEDEPDCGSGPDHPHGTPGVGRKDRDLDPVLRPSRTGVHVAGLVRRAPDGVRVGDVGGDDGWSRASERYGQGRRLGGADGGGAAALSSQGGFDGERHSPTPEPFGLSRPLQAGTPLAMLLTGGCPTSGSWPEVNGSYWRNHDISVSASQLMLGCAAPRQLSPLATSDVAVRIKRPRQPQLRLFE